MLRLTDLTLSRGHKTLLQNAQLTVFPGQKIGIIGANGSGKSSLFALLRGELLPDAGSCDLPAVWKIAWVQQETPASAQTTVDYILAGDPEFIELETAIAGVSSDECTDNPVDAAQIAELHQRYQDIDGYSARARAEQLMAGLGFAPGDKTRLVTDFSGGYRMRLNLAQALMTRADLLLLDEPTNHLDLETVIWLEDWLRRYPSTVLIISHDRDFLDATVGHILHLENQQLKLYSGNYATFEVQRAQSLAYQAATVAQQERQKAHLQAFIDRFRAQATKAKQVQSRIKALERMQLVMPAYADSPFSFSFFPPSKCANPLLRLEKASIGYAVDSPILKDINQTLYATDRIGILGPNGAGKSTFIKALAGTLPLLTGENQTATALKIGYFAQHQLEQLRLEASPLWHLQQLSPETREQELRDFLGGFNFCGDSATQSIQHCSGGEKARLALALLVWQRPHLLLLDEPTNHLDLDMREALTEALQSYEGALILVSHDRHLLRTTVDQFWLIAHQQAQVFTGDLEDYQHWVQTKYREPMVVNPSNRAPLQNPLDRKEERRLAAEARQRLTNQKRPLTQELNNLEKTLADLHSELKNITDFLASTEAYQEAMKNQLTYNLKRQGELQIQTNTLETRWYELQSELEALEASSIGVS